MQLGEVELLQRTTKGPSQPRCDPTWHLGHGAIGNLSLMRDIGNGILDEFQGSKSHKNQCPTAARPECFPAADRRHKVRQKASSARFIAGDAGFFTFTQCGRTAVRGRDPLATALDCHKP
jgi:hypothetical protein